MSICDDMCELAYLNQGKRIRFKVGAWPAYVADRRGLDDGPLDQFQGIPVDRVQNDGKGVWIEEIT